MAKKKKSSYWLKRALEAEKKVNDGAKDVENKVIQSYRLAQYYLTKKAKKLFERAVSKTGLEEDEVKKILNEHVPVEDLVELQKLAQDVDNPELQSEAKKRLDILAMKGRITRVEDLKAKSYLVSKQVADVQLEKSTDFYIDTIHDSYNEATAQAFIHRMESKGITIEIWNRKSKEKKNTEKPTEKQKEKPINEKESGIEETEEIHEFKELSTPAVQKILDSHWQGSNYSKRIWGDTEALAKRLEELFTVEAMTGMSEFEMTQAIAKEFDRSVGVARRLIRTEANYMANQAKLKAWQDSGVKEYMLVAVLDLRTSSICRHKDHKIYKVSEAVVNGAEGTYPPFHPWCRTVAIAYFGKRSAEGTRVANDPITGETFTINNSDSYDDWMKKLKEKYSDEEIERQKKKIRYASKDKTDLKRLQDVIGKENSPETLEEYQEIKYNDGEKWEQIKRQYRTIKEIHSKDWSDEFKTKVTSTYYDFFKNGYEFSSHALGRYVQRANLSVTDAVKILSQKNNYTQSDGRKVWYYDNHAFIKNSKDTEFVTYVKRKNAKTDWREL